MMIKAYKNEVVLFHGTINPTSILTEGFTRGNDTIWNCSDWDYVYFYELEKFMEAECIDDEKDGYLRILGRTNEQSQVQNAFLEAPYNKTYVLEFHFPSEFRQFIEEDESCEGMGSYGAVQVDIDVLNDWLKTKPCEVYLHTYRFVVKNSLMYISGLIDNEFALPGLERLPEYELQIMKALSKEFNEAFWEDFILCPEETHFRQVSFTFDNV